MKSNFLGDGNYIGRLGAIVLIAAAGFGLHRLSCEGGMCPVMKTDSCCGGEIKAAVKPAAPSPAK